MAGQVGFRLLADLALPSGWDPTLIASRSLRDGTTLDRVVSLLNSAVGAFNATLKNNTIIAQTSFITSDDKVRYRTDDGVAFRRHTELGKPVPQKGRLTGHMMEQEEWDSALGWSWDYLRKADLAQINADVAGLLVAAGDLWEKTILTRLFKAEAVTIGTSGISPPFADAGATLAYTPPSYQGNAFTSAHSHLVGLSGFTQANVNTLAANLAEHGYEPPYLMYVSQSDVGSWSAVATVTGFKKVQQTGIQYADNADYATIPSELYIGVIETPSGSVWVRPQVRIPTGYAVMFKSYGPNDQRNPLRLWFNPQDGFGLMLVPGIISGHPEYMAIVDAELGASVGQDRTAAVLWQNTAGAYASPTIT